MSIRMKLANWLSGGEIQSLQLWGSRMQREANGLREQRGVSLNMFDDVKRSLDQEIENLKSELYLERGHTNSLRASLTKIYNIPCKPNSNGSVIRAHKIAAHALWKE